MNTVYSEPAPDNGTLVITESNGILPQPKMAEWELKLYYHEQFMKSLRKNKSLDKE